MSVTSIGTRWCTEKFWDCFEFNSIGETQKTWSFFQRLQLVFYCVLIYMGLYICRQYISCTSMTHQQTLTMEEGSEKGTSGMCSWSSGKNTWSGHSCCKENWIYLNPKESRQRLYRLSGSISCVDCPWISEK